MGVETNQKIAERAESLIKTYDRLLDNLGEIEEYMVADVIADLMHYCQTSRFDVESVVEKAFHHFYDEIWVEKQDNPRNEDSP
jgi:hypothetical protein